MADDEDEDDDTSVVVPIVQRGGTRLDIENFVDLRNANLLNRYDGKVEIAQVSLGISAKKSAAAWVEESYDMEKFTF